MFPVTQEEGNCPERDFVPVVDAAVDGNPSVPHVECDRLQELLKKNYTDASLAAILLDQGNELPLEAAIQVGACVFECIRALAWSLEQGKTSFQEVMAVLARMEIHPASLLSATLDSDVRRAWGQAMPVGLPAIWWEILQVPVGQLGPEPARLCIQGRLTIAGLDLSELPSGMAVEGSLQLIDLPRLRTLPPDLRPLTSLTVRRCPEFIGWPNAMMANEEMNRTLCESLGCGDAGQGWHFEDCPKFATLPPAISSSLSLQVLHCPAFKILPRLSCLEGRAYLVFGSTLPGVRSLGGLSCSQLSLCDLPDLEEVTRHGGKDGDPEVMVELQSLPSLRRIGGFAERATILVRDCPRIETFNISPKTTELTVTDCHNLGSFTGRFRGQSLEITRCVNLKNIPKFNKKSQKMILRDVPKLINTMLMSRFGIENKNFHENAGSPMLIFDDWMKENQQSTLDSNILNNISSLNDDLLQFEKNLSITKSIFTKVRLLARGLANGACVEFINQQLKIYKINPISLLLDIPSPSRLYLLSYLLGLPQDLQGQLCFGGLMGGHGSPLEILLPDSLYPEKNLKVPGDVRFFHETMAANLPDGFEVEGSLAFDHCSGLRRLPEDLHIKGDLWLNHLPDLEALPRSLTVEGNLYLRGLPNLKVWPCWMAVRGRVDAEP
jgi:hypothetical protein